MSSVIAAGGLGKERQKISTRAAVMRATSLREGAFSRRLMVGWEQRSRPLSGARPTASLKRGSPRRASQSSASSYPQAIREHAEAKHRRQRVDHPLRVAPLPDTTRQRLGQAEPAFGPAQQDPARRRTRSARPRNRRSPSCGLRLEDRTAEEYLRSWRAWRSRCLGRNALGNEFLPDLNGLRHVRHHIVAPQGIKRDSTMPSLSTMSNTGTFLTRIHVPICRSTIGLAAISVSPFICSTNSLADR